MIFCHAVVYQATWGNDVSSVTWNGWSFSGLRRRRRGTWSLQPAWLSSFPCSLSQPVSPTAMGKRKRRQQKVKGEKKEGGKE